MKRLRLIRRDDKGNATIEFGLFASMFFMVMMVALDFGMYLTYQLRLSAAVEQGSMLAFNNRENINTGQISGYVTSASRLPGGNVTVALQCNGTNSCTNSNRQCACLSANGKTFSSAASCGATCADGSTSGYYLGIAASYPYSAVVVPNKWLEGTTISQSSMVRLQ